MRGAPLVRAEPAPILQDHPEQTIVRGPTGYRTLRKIDIETQSRIYLANRLSDGLEVALKIIAVNILTDQLVLERFRREAAALQAMRSPYVVRFHEHAFEVDCEYLVMAHLPGSGLRVRMKEPLDVQTSVAFVLQLLLALDVRHTTRVVHRDSKPTNVLMHSSDTLPVTDFGVSRRLDSDPEHTTDGMPIGTPAYMRPEQCMGRPVDERADICQ